MNLFIVILIILTIILLIALLGNKDMQIEKSILIRKPGNEVFEYVRFLKNHDNFNVWAMMDPDMKKEYRGTDGREGFVFAWDSIKQKNVGAGEQEIKKINDGKYIEFELRFLRPMNDVAKSVLITEPVAPDQTRVQWGFYSKMKFPMNLMKPMIKNMLGKSIETGLQNLKGVMENPS